ncbi:MAG: anion permease [Deltaproteobacteria bacterium]
MTFAIVLLAVFGLAYANGANDNFKGVATLFGSGITDYRKALWWGTAATCAGSVAAVLLAEKLLSNFSGKGLVDNGLTTDPQYLAAVACGAGLTVLVATFVGMPISTTHGLVGALVGAGWAAGSKIGLDGLGTTFFLPLLISPVLALIITGVGYALLHAIRVRFGITEETCFCVGQQTIEVVPRLESALTVERVEQLTISRGTAVTCRNRYAGRFLGIDVAEAVDRLHFLSAGAVSFARGLNDTPKIAALLLVAPALGKAGAIVLVGALILVGGLLSARRVAETMSRKITPMNHGQGFTANLVTSMIVLAASNLGLPVSTTHVSCGALFGIGTVNRHAHWKMIGTILAAWLTTLPCGAALGALAYVLLGTFASPV